LGQSIKKFWWAMKLALIKGYQVHNLLEWQNQKRIAGFVVFDLGHVLVVEVRQHGDCEFEGESVLAQKVRVGDWTG